MGGSGLTGALGSARPRGLCGSRPRIRRPDVRAGETLRDASDGRTDRSLADGRTPAEFIEKIHDEDDRVLLRLHVRRTHGHAHGHSFAIGSEIEPAGAAHACGPHARFLRDERVAARGIADSHDLVAGQVQQLAAVRRPPG